MFITDLDALEVLFLSDIAKLVINTWADGWDVV